MAEPYDSIAIDSFSRFLSEGVSNQGLRRYYAACFQDSIDRFAIYQSWACSSCISEARTTAGWGEKPSQCPTCALGTVYEIATFQSRSTVVGNAFGSAFFYLMRTYYRIPIVPTPGNTGTHDFEVSGGIAIEAKGSPARVLNPDRSVTRLSRPGMERSDTEKKAFANGRLYHQRNQSGYFCIVSNAVPSHLVGYRGSDVNAIFDVTKVERIEAMIEEIRGRVDIESLRNYAGL